MDPNNLTPDEAVQVLDEIAAEHLMNRLSHFTAQQAVGTLRGVLVERQAMKDEVLSRDGAKEEEVPVE